MTTATATATATKKGGGRKKKTATESPATGSDLAAFGLDDGPSAEPAAVETSPATDRDALAADATKRDDEPAALFEDLRWLGARITPGPLADFLMGVTQETTDGWGAEQAEASDAWFDLYCDWMRELLEEPPPDAPDWLVTLAENAIHGEPVDAEFTVASEGEGSAVPDEPSGADVTVISETGPATVSTDVEGTAWVGPANTTTTTAPPKPATPANAPRVRSKAEVIDNLNQQQIQLRKQFRDAEESYESAKEEAAECKKYVKQIQRRMNSAVDDLAAAMAGNATNKLFTEDGGAVPAVAEKAAEIGRAAPAPENVGEVPEKPVESVESGALSPAALPPDPAKTTKVVQIGLTEAQVDKLAAYEPPIETVADLEAAINAGNLQKVKGIGEKAIDKITDKLMEWRKANPVPTAE